MKKFLHTLSVSASLAVLSAGEAFAGAASHADGHSAPHGTTGMPQMDPTWFASQLFWLAVTFLVLYVVFAKKILPELSGVLETRREHIQGDLDTAQKLKDEATSVHQAYDEILEEARQKSSDAFVSVDEDIKSKSESEFSAFQDRAQKETEAFEARITKAKQDAMEEMNSIAAEVAAEAVEKIIGVSTDMKNAEDAVKSLNKQRKKAA